MDSLTRTIRIMWILIGFIPATGLEKVENSTEVMSAPTTQTNKYNFIIYMIVILIFVICGHFLWHKCKSDNEKPPSPRIPIVSYRRAISQPSENRVKTKTLGERTTNELQIADSPNAVPVGTMTSTSEIVEAEKMDGTIVDVNDQVRLSNIL